MITVRDLSEQEKTDLGVKPRAKKAAATPAAATPAAGKAARPKMTVRREGEVRPENMGATLPTDEMEVADIGSFDELMAEFEEDVIIHERVIMGKRWYIKELDMWSLIDVETQRMVVEKNEIVRKPNHEAKMGLTLEFATCLMRKVGDTYEPMFTMQSVQGLFTKAQARPLINALANAIYEVNTSLSPIKKAQAAQAVHG